MSFLCCPLGEWVVKLTVLLFVVILSDVFIIALSESAVYVLSKLTGSVMLRPWNFVGCLYLRLRAFGNCESAECFKSSYCHLWLTVSALWFMVLERCTAVQCSRFVLCNWCPWVTVCFCLCWISQSVVFVSVSICSCELCIPVLYCVCRVVS